MFFIPDEYTVKKMADLVREKDKILLERADKTAAAEAAIETAKKQLDAITQETDDLLSLPWNTAIKKLNKISGSGYQDYRQ